MMFLRKTSLPPQANKHLQESQWNGLIIFIEAVMLYILETLQAFPSVWLEAHEMAIFLKIHS